MAGVVWKRIVRLPSGRVSAPACGMLLTAVWPAGMVTARS